MPKAKRTFEVEVEATLLVDAFDEGSARKKIAKTFARNRRLDADVRSSGDLVANDVATAADDSS